MNVSILNKIKQFNINHHNMSLIFIAILMAFFTGILSDQVTSFIYPMATGNSYTNDPNMFYYMGKLFINGYKPYYGFFDHKGPYIFYFTGLAHILGGRFGMILLHTIIFGIFYYFLFKIYEEYRFSKIITICMTLLLMSIIIICGQNPSDSEIEYPLISVGLYYYIKAINNKEDKYFLYGNIIAGLCAGIAIHLRLTEAIVPFGMVVYFGIRELVNKKYKNIIINALVCLGGVVITSLPPLIHSLCGGFTGIMYESIIFNNMSYAGGLFSSYSIESITSRLVIIGLLILASICIVVLKKKNKISLDETLFYGIVFGITLVLEFITAYYLHYLLIVFPLVFIFLGRVLSFIDFNKVIKNICLLTTFIIFIISSLIFPILNYSTQIKKDNAINEYINLVIPEECKIKQVLCYVTSASIYTNNNILVGYPDFASQDNHIRFSKEYTLDRLIDYAINSECKYIIIDNEISSGSFVDWLMNNDYYKKDNSDVEGNKYISIYVKTNL